RYYSTYVNTILYIVWLHMKRVIDAKPLTEHNLAGFGTSKMRHDMQKEVCKKSLPRMLTRAKYVPDGL
ncbi:MAG: hypothetical protein ACLQU3_05950, partial [Limisphaerales bacterium]